MPHSKSKKQLAREHDERRSLKLWRSPFKTLYFFILECFYQLLCLCHAVLRYKVLTTLTIISLTVLAYLRCIDGPHKETLLHLEKKLLWWGWWVLLGFLSSCGFGSGLHTFVLYLGPFIAQVTMSAYICGTLDFPEPPYPDKIICPDQTGDVNNISFLSIVRKLQVESILWGFGTAIGELPPYFMARGARLSGKLSADEMELSLNSNSSSSEHEVDTKKTSSSPEKLSSYQRLELFLQRLVMRAGFLGILLCASVPNPLFDLAGMTCGHFLVPFATFFGATVIGKALIKVHIQQFAVIAVSSESHVDTLVEYMGQVPFFGPKLQRPFMAYLQQQKDKLHNKIDTPSESWLQFAISMIVTAAMVMFIVSIVNAMAQANHRRSCRQAATREPPKNATSRAAVPVSKNNGVKGQSKKEN